MNDKLWTTPTLLLLLLGLCLVTFGQDDPCTFLAVVNGASWTVAEVQKVSACFNSIPLSAQVKGDTIAQVRKLVDLYSFTDISKNSGAPFHIQV